MRRVMAAALPDANRYSGDNVTVTIEYEDGSIANLVYVANGDRAVGKEFFEVFCAGGVARIDDFKLLLLTRNELTIAAMNEGKDAPIPFDELIEVSETTFAIVETLERSAS
jgi:polar amino acid transport system substrate-binding protein